MTIAGNGVLLREIEMKDLEMVRLWRNDPKISQFMLSQEQITPAQQQQWFDLCRQSSTQMHFVILYKDHPIGVANIKSVGHKPLSESHAFEPGLYIYDDRYRGNFLSFCPALTLNDYCFEYLGCDRLTARVLKNNEAAIRFNKQLGYEVDVGRDDDEPLLKMSLTKELYDVHSAKIRRFIRF